MSYTPQELTAVLQKYKAGKQILTCHCGERSAAAIRIPLGLCGVIMRREGTRIPTTSLRTGRTLTLTFRRRIR